MRPSALIAAVLIAAPVGLLPAAPATAAAPAGALGADVSTPQCTGQDLMGFDAPLVAPEYAIVGVNDGRGTVTNPCLAAEAAWAATLPGGGRARLELYVNTQHPAPTAAKWWPTGDQTAAGVPVRSPYGSCHGRDDRACAYVYGASITGDDLARAAAVQLVPSAQRWWLDVETTNDWSSDTAKNRAVLEGMVTAFAHAHVATGLYSTHRQWDQIVGAVPRSSALAGLPSWLSGATTTPGAMVRCTSTPLVPGSRVELGQAVPSVQPATDADVACARLAAAPTPRVTGTPAAGQLLHAVVGRWRPNGIAFAYRWLRDGKPMPHATAATYRVTWADRHHVLSVRVTGTLAGYDAAIRESAARHVR